MFQVIHKDDVYDFFSKYSEFENGDIYKKLQLYNAYLILPRYSDKIFPFDKYKKINIPGTNIQDVNFKFTKTLKQSQEQAISAFKENFEKTGNYSGLLIAKCGFGKTVVSVYLAAMIGKKTLIVVDENNLQKQWVSEILEFSDLEEDQVGLIMSGKNQIDRPVVVTTVQSLISKMKTDFKQTINDFSEFGLVIYDEAHASGSSIKYSMSSTIFATDNIIGITATPNLMNINKDLFNATFGNIIYSDKEYDIIPEINFVIYDSGINIKNYLKLDHKRRPMVYCQEVTKSKVYLDVVKQLNDSIISDEKRALINLIMTVTGKTSQANLLMELLAEHKPAKLFGKSQKPPPGHRNIIGTQRKGSKAFNYPSLTDVIITYPTKNAINIEQIIGRISRTNMNLDVTRRVWFMIDECMGHYFINDMVKIKEVINTIYKGKNVIFNEQRIK